MSEEETADAPQYDEGDLSDGVWDLYSTRIITFMIVAVIAGVYIVTGISLLGAALNEVLKRRGRRLAARRAKRHRGR